MFPNFVYSSLRDNGKFQYIKVYLKFVTLDSILIKYSRRYEKPLRICAVPPDILDYPTSSDQVAREGANVTLRCAAHGVPTPTVVWRKEAGDLLPTSNFSDTHSKHSKICFFLLFRLISFSFSLFSPYFLTSGQNFHAFFWNGKSKMTPTALGGADRTGGLVLTKTHTALCVPFFPFFSMMFFCFPFHEETI